MQVFFFGLKGECHCPHCSPPGSTTAHCTIIHQQCTATEVKGCVLKHFMLHTTSPRVLVLRGVSSECVQWVWWLVELVQQFAKDLEILNISMVHGISLSCGPHAANSYDDIDFVVIWSTVYVTSNNIFVKQQCHLCCGSVHGILWEKGS